MRPREELARISRWRYSADWGEEDENIFLPAPRDCQYANTRFELDLSRYDKSSGERSFAAHYDATILDCLSTKVWISNSKIKRKRPRHNYDAVLRLVLALLLLRVD